ncbi:MAG: toxin-antitoxin system HicB family antitoxin [Pseudomonadales bacterium]
MLCMPSEIHAAVATAAELSGKSIDQWASEVLNR